MDKDSESRQKIIFVYERYFIKEIDNRARAVNDDIERKTDILEGPVGIYKVYRNLTDSSKHNQIVVLSSECIVFYGL